MTSESSYTLFPMPSKLPLVTSSRYCCLDVESEDQGNDCHVVIADIINNHNKTMQDMPQANTNMLLEGLIPEPSKILPTEVAPNTALVRSFTE